MRILLWVTACILACIALVGCGERQSAMAGPTTPPKVDPEPPPAVLVDEGSVGLCIGTGAWVVRDVKTGHRFLVVRETSGGAAVILIPDVKKEAERASP